MELLGTDRTLNKCPTHEASGATEPVPNRPHHKGRDAAKPSRPFLFLG